MSSSTFGPKTVGIWNEFFKAPPEKEEVEEALAARLKPFLTQAFRRPVQKKTLLLPLPRPWFAQEGDSFEATMKGVVSCGSGFPALSLLTDSLGPEEEAMSRGVFLASRLSFFLWGSLPDEELLEHALAGRLSDPKVFDGQLDRMLSDPKLKRFCDSFPTQWLQLDRIISSVRTKRSILTFTTRLLVTGRPWT